MAPRNLPLASWMWGVVETFTAWLPPACLIPDLLVYSKIPAGFSCKSQLSSFWKLLHEPYLGVRLLASDIGLPFGLVA